MVELKKYSRNNERENIVIHILGFFEKPDKADRNDGVHQNSCPNTKEARVEPEAVDPKYTEFEVFYRVSKIGIVE